MNHGVNGDVPGELLQTDGEEEGQGNYDEHFT